VIAPLKMEVNQLLVAQLLMVVVDGYKLVLFLYKAKAERACKPKLGFFALEQT